MVIPWHLFFYNGPIFNYKNLYWIMTNGKIVQLKDIDTLENEYPVVLTDGVFNREGDNLNIIIDTTKEDLEKTIQNSLYEKVVPEGFVDLDLPSGNLWAKTPLDGAYQYGGLSTVSSPYISNWSSNVKTTDEFIPAEYDIATKTFGENAHIPRIDECEELLKYTDVFYYSDEQKIRFVSRKNPDNWFEFGGKIVKCNTGGGNWETGAIFETNLLLGWVSNNASFKGIISSTNKQNIFCINSDTLWEYETDDEGKVLLEITEDYSFAPFYFTKIYAACGCSVHPVMSPGEFKEIYVKDSDYQKDKKESDKNIKDRISDIQQKTLTTNYNSESADIYTLKRDSGDSELQLTFTPLSPLSLTIPEQVGDFEMGTTSSSLNGKPISEILDSILFKTIYPTITEHSVKITGTVTSLQKPTNTIWSGYNYNFNKGTVVVNDGVTPNQDYVGAASNPRYFVKYVSGDKGTDYPIFDDELENLVDADPSLVSRYEVGQYQYKVTVDYGVGPIMKTSKGSSPNPIKTSVGNSVTNPAPAGSISSEYGCTMNFSLPVWIDDAKGNYVEQTLKKWGSWTFTGIQMEGTTASNPIRIKSPRTLKSANSFNEVSGKYDVPQLSNFSMNRISENINGVLYKYFEYVWTGGAAGAVAFEIITN